jgi:DNA-binding FadR family transcriptional regulator
MTEFQDRVGRGRLADNVALRLRERIVGRDIPVGEKLPTEKELGEAFGVSRTVVREAIAQLKTEDLVVVRQGVGVFAAEPVNAAFRVPDGVNAHDRFTELYELRRAVETEGAGLAAVRRGSEDLKALRHQLAAMENAEDRAKADLAFHATLAQATGNTLFASFIQFLGVKFEDAIRSAVWNTIRAHAGEVDGVILEHEAIYRAVEQGDAHDAQTAMARHLDRAANRMGLRVSATF